MNSKKLVPDVETYNAVIKNILSERIFSFTQEAFDRTMNILVTMSQQGIKPNLKTFNSFLSSISKMGNSKLIPRTALEVLKEMKLLNIG